MLYVSGMTTIFVGGHWALALSGGGAMWFDMVSKEKAFGEEGS